MRILCDSLALEVAQAPLFLKQRKLALYIAKGGGGGVDKGGHSHMWLWPHRRVNGEVEGGDVGFFGPLMPKEERREREMELLVRGEGR